MSSPRLVALAVVVVAGGLVAGCGRAAGETSVTPPAVPVSMSRTGGIAGVSQSIDIAPDGTWVYTDKRMNQSERGALGPDQRLQLLRLVNDPVFSQELSKFAKPDTTCADGFHYTISTNGDARSFEDCGSTDAPTVKAAITMVTQATPF